MRSSELISIARRRASLSQAALATRLEMARSNISRYETGAVTPSFERLSEIVEACGLELVPELVTFDNSYESHIARQLGHDPITRIRTMGGDPGELLALARVLEQSGIHYVATGPIAACLHGSPRRLDLPALELVVAPTDIEELRECVTSAGLRSGTAVKYTAAPPNTRGVRDLLLDSESIVLSDDVALRVASLLDLLRVAQHPTSGEPLPSVLLELLRASRGERRSEAQRREAEQFVAIGAG